MRKFRPNPEGGICSTDGLRFNRGPTFSVVTARRESGPPKSREGERSCEKPCHSWSFSLKSSLESITTPRRPR